MESLILSGIVIAVLGGVLVNLWHFVIHLISKVVLIAGALAAIGFLFGGMDAFTAEGMGEWADFLDVLLGDGVGERVIGAFWVFVSDMKELWTQ